MNTYGRYPIVISHGKGCYLYDVNGKQYLDMAAGIATCCLGIVWHIYKLKLNLNI
jgi:acetylornithine/N-succinyldiaminopimelate aminotransferase